MKRIFSGIRPTGQIHIGNYLGAIAQWIQLQDKEDCIFSIVDWHAIVTPYDEKKLQERIFDLATTYLACGLNPDKCILFVQSQVKEHVELAWLLGSLIPLGELKRMTQFKDKSEKHPEYVNAGLLNYPILMAADILLYDANEVPIGQDQKQHLELTRNIAEKFNNKYGNTFVIPEPMILKEGAKIMSLQNPEKKMSKTDDIKGCIGLFDSPLEILEKIMAATTDSGKEIKYDIVNKKGISNLLNIYSIFSGKPIKEIEKEFEGKGYVEFKTATGKLVAEKLEEIRNRKKALMDRKEYVYEILEKGSEKAKKIASEKMEKVRKAMGLN